MKGPRRSYIAPFAALAALVVAAAVGCHSDMYDQPKLEPLEPSSFFDDGRSARPLEPGVVSREEPTTEGPLETGRDANGPLTTLPLPLTQALVERGRERFTIYCAPCHGRIGDGDGMIVLRGFRRPPSFHTDKVRGLPVGQLYNVITQGFGTMPPYRKQIPRDDRWAITAYVRALQLSRFAPADELTDAEREQLSGISKGTSE
jgi:mono/diheme cytochrome c family protein